MSTKKSVFEILNAIDVSEHTEEKNRLTYLSWAWAWRVMKENFPEAQYKVYETEAGMIYHTDGRTAWVKVGVTVDSIEHIEYLPVMDYRNNSIPIDTLTSTDINKAIQRALTKAIARHGLGLYIYAGEDLPTEPAPPPPPKPITPQQKENIITLLEETEADIVKFLKVFRVKNVDEMSFDIAAQALKSLNLKKKKMEEAQNGTN